MIDRYEHQGLRANPFAVIVESDALSELFVDRQLPDPPPASSRTLVQVIGDKGAGKSSQLRHWRRRAPGPYHYVPRPYRERWTRPPVEVLVYGDELDRMPAPLRWRWMQELASAGATLVAGTHVDLAPIARRAGLAVITHCLEPVDLATVRAILHAKVQHMSILSAVTRPGERFVLTEAEIGDIHRRCGGSIRTAEVLAHELVARRVHHFDAANPSQLLQETQ